MKESNSGPTQNILNQMGVLKIESIGLVTQSVKDKGRKWVVKKHLTIQPRILESV